MAIETAQLQAENQRLNLFLSLLIEKNRLLEYEISQVRGALAMQPKIAIPGSQNENTLPPISILSNRLSGIEILNNSPSLQVDRIETAENLRNNFLHGIEQEGISTKILQQVIDNINAIPSNLTHGREAPPPAALALSNLIIRQQLALSLTVDAIYKALKQSEMLKVSQDGVLRVAKVLLLLCKEDRVSYAAIHKQVTMTNSGITKLMMALKRRGLIEKIGFQQYALTPKALTLLTEATTFSQTTIGSR